jgi:hypothetical protein
MFCLDRSLVDPKIPTTVESNLDRLTKKNLNEVTNKEFIVPLLAPELIWQWITLQFTNIVGVLETGGTLEGPSSW